LRAVVEENKIKYGGCKQVELRMNSQNMFGFGKPPYGVWETV